MPTVADITRFLSRLAPLDAAEPWDNVGLLLGDEKSAAERVMTCLTVTSATVDEAVAGGVQLLVSHHPILFRPVQRLAADTPEGGNLLQLARAGIAVFSLHTAYDNAAGGINDILCRRIGLTEVRPLRQPRPCDAENCKIVVFVPESDLQRVSDALFAAGAGVIGEYRECSFRVAGTGTFFGGEGSNPAVGEKGRREQVAEWRLEAVCPRRQLESVVQAMRQAHSYEEPAYDVYPLVRTSSHGAGRLGRLPQPLPLDDFARLVVERLSAAGADVSGAGERRVAHVAVACGAAGEFLHDAVHADADVFVTGEMRYHEIVAAQERGLALVLPGHYASERPGVVELAETLHRQFPALTVWASRREADVCRRR